jgi:hypothetical protein
MFGTLDYRAHKLFRLLSFPLIVCGKLAFFVVVAIVIFAAQQTDYSLLVKILLAYVTMEAIALVTAGMWFLVMWIFQAMFFWIVDVMPSKGLDEEEAREVVKKGRFVWLARKFAWDIGGWNGDDTRAFVSALNWRARLLFDARGRFERRVRRMKQYFDETGLQPGALRPDEIDELVGEKSSWFETAVVHPYYFNSILGVASSW